MKVNAYAKINLTLDVLNKREDGYHEISSVMQTISLCDVLSFNIEDRKDNENEIIIGFFNIQKELKDFNLKYEISDNRKENE